MEQRCRGYHIKRVEVEDLNVIEIKEWRRIWRLWSVAQEETKDTAD